MGQPCHHKKRPGCRRGHKRATPTRSAEGVMLPKATDEFDGMNEVKTSVLCTARVEIVRKPRRILTTDCADDTDIKHPSSNLRPQRLMALSHSSLDLSHPVAPEQTNPSAETCQCPANQESGEFNHVGIGLALRWVHSPEAAAPWARSRAIAKETATG